MSAEVKTVRKTGDGGITDPKKRKERIAKGDEGRPQTGGRPTYKVPTSREHKG